MPNLTSLKRMTLLFVEDKMLLQTQLQETLSIFFGRVFVASNGQEALGLLAGEPRSNFRVIGVFILTLLLSPPSFAFDMVEILTNAVHVSRSGFLTTDQELSPQAVLLMAQ